MPSATSNSPLSLGLVKLLSRPEPNILQNTAVDKGAANFCLSQSNLTCKTCNFFPKRRRSIVLYDSQTKTWLLLKKVTSSRLCFWAKRSKRTTSVLSDVKGHKAEGSCSFSTTTIKAFSVWEWQMVKWRESRPNKKHDPKYLCLLVKLEGNKNNDS